MDNNIQIFQMSAAFSDVVVASELGKNVQLGASRNNYRLKVHHTDLPKLSR